MSALSILFALCTIGLLFTMIRGSVIDLKTEYVPDNIIISAYFFSITYVIGSCIIQKNFSNLKIGLLGFFVSFIIPWILMSITFYYRCIVWKIENKGKKMPKFEENLLEKNPDIKRKEFIIFYILGIAGTFIITFITKRYVIIPLVIVGLIIELIVGRLLKRFYVIKEDYTINKYNECKTEEEELEDYLYGGIGGGDIILFGAIGILFGSVGFIITMIYSIFSHIIILIIYSVIKKINPFKYPIPFLPALASGILLYSFGMDQHLFNFFNMFMSLM